MDNLLGIITATHLSITCLFIIICSVHTEAKWLSIHKDIVREMFSNYPPFQPGPRCWNEK